MKLDIILIDMLNQIASDPSKSVSISSSTLKNIEAIRNICNKEYYDQRFYGNASLNRKFLLNKKISELLTPETIIAILQLHAQSTTLDKTNPIAVIRNSSGYISLASILFYGFTENFNAIKKTPTNDLNYGEKSYAQQQNNFDRHTVNIINNILVAAKYLNINIDDTKYKSSDDKASLIDTAKQVKDFINIINYDSKTITNLLTVPGYTTEDILNQTQEGFIYLCDALDVKYKLEDNNLMITKPKSLVCFVEDIFNSNALLHGKISHLLFDRVHFEASYFTNFNIIIGNKSFKIKDVIYELIKTCEHPKFKNTITHEQLSLRLNAVHTHLSNVEQIKISYSQESLDLIAKNYSNSYFNIKSQINHYNQIINDALWNKNDITSTILIRNFLQGILDIYDKANGDRPLYLCWKDAKSKDPTGAIVVDETLGMEFLMNIISDNQSITLTQGPRQKSQATTELENIISLLLSNYKNLSVKFNSLNELEIIINGNHFNLTTILKNHPDYEQIILSDQQLQTYANLVLQKMKMKPSLNGSNDFPTPKDYDDNDKTHSCSHLHYGEKLALSIYTSPDHYKIIQNFLRSYGQSDQFQSYSSKNLTPLVFELLLHIGVASHGLSKPVENPLKNFARHYRLESGSTADSFIQERIESIKTKKPIEASGFTSTSEHYVLVNDDNTKKNTFVIVDEAHSNYHLGKKINAVSAFNNEAEVLYIPGTQFQNKMYAYYNDLHFFSTSPIRSIDNKDNNNYSAPMIAWHELEIIDKLFELHLKTNQHSAFRQHFDTVANDDKNACILHAKQAIRHVLDTLKHHDKLEVTTLEKCKFEIEQAIEKNRALVKRAFFHASLGKTHDILNDALCRVNKSLKILKPYLNEIIDNRHYHQSEYDKRYGLVLKKSK